MSREQNLGGWVPISKTLLSELPKDRAFTRLEAMFSLTIDYDQGGTATIKGYSVLWGWSQGKVKRFLLEVGVVISYPQNTNEKQNQRGEIMIQITERSYGKKEQIKMIGSKWLEGQTERSVKPNGERTERSQVTTRNPNPKPLKEESRGNRFIIPSEAEVREYMAEIDYLGDAQRFVDHYTANGWTIGKSRMMDWRAAVRTWRKNDAERKVSAMAEASTIAPHPVTADEAAKLRKVMERAGSIYDN